MTFTWNNGLTATSAVMVDAPSSVAGAPVTFTDTSILAVGTHQITGLYSGDAIYFPSYTGYVAAAVVTPVYGFTLSASPVNFGTVPLGASRTKLVTLTNSGNAARNLGGISAARSAPPSVSG